MVFSWADNRNPNSLASKMRRERVKLLNELLTRFKPPVRILDVGGTGVFWASYLSELTQTCEITLLNLGVGSTEGLSNVTALSGDARKMPQFGDATFDIVFSNSVIEHVGTLFDQRAMAREIRRVGRAYLVQTPYRYFPLEPHFLVPLWQFMPVALRAKWLQHRTVGWMPRQPDYLEAKADVEQIRLLTIREMKWLFPDGVIRRETIGPLTKSLMAVHY